MRNVFTACRRPVLGAALWALTAGSAKGDAAASVAGPREVTASIRQAASQQEEVRGAALRTVATLRELSDELVFNRFRDPALNRHVATVGGALEKAGNEYMAKAAQELEVLLGLADEAARKGKLAEVDRLQDTILNLLQTIRNARLAADGARLRRLLEASLRSQRATLERTKALLFDPAERVPMGRDPESLSPDEQGRLESTVALQAGTVAVLGKALAEFHAAAALKDAGAGGQAAAAGTIAAFLAQEQVAPKAEQARMDLEQNRATQAMASEQAVIVVLERALRLVEDATRTTDRQLAALANARDRIKALLEQQVTLRGESETLSPNEARAKTLPVQFEARQDRLGAETKAVGGELPGDGLAGQSLQQAAAAMAQAETHLGGADWSAAKAPAVDAMRLAESALAAALLALERDMAALDSAPKTSDAAKQAEELRKQAEAAAQMAKALEEAAKREQAIEQATQRAQEKAPEQAPETAALAEKQEQLQREVQALQAQLQPQAEPQAQPQEAPPRKQPAAQAAREAAAQQMQQAQQSMQTAARQLQQDQPKNALPAEQQARQSLQQAAEQMQQTAKALAQQQQAAQMRALANQLNAMAEQQAALHSPFDKARDPQAQAAVQEKQQGLQKQLSQMRQKEPSLGQNAEKAEKAMQEARAQMQALQKEPGSGGPAKPKAKQAMMNAQSALQQEAQQMQEAAAQMQQAAEQDLAKASKSGKRGNKPPGSGMGGGNQKEGDSTARLNARPSGVGWEAKMSGRERVQFSQDAERKLPAEYSKLVEGYYRRLAREGRE